MGLRINTNVEAYSAWKTLSQTHVSLSKSMNRLSTGLRVSSAADDAAGLAISEGMRNQITGNAQAMRNAQDGVSLIQTAEGSMHEMHSVLQRIRELAVQYANGTLSTSDQAKVTAEIAQLTAELERLRGQAYFNGVVLFGVTIDTQLTIQVGANQNQDSVGNTNRIGITINALDWTTLDTSSPSVGAIDVAIASVSAARATVGALQNRLEHAIADLGTQQENLMSSESRIRDVDMAAEMAQVTRLQILAQAGTSMLAQANASPQAILPLLKG